MRVHIYTTRQYQQPRRVNLFASRSDFAVSNGEIEHYQAAGRSFTWRTHAFSSFGNSSARPISARIRGASAPGRCGGSPTRMGVRDSLTGKPGAVVSPTPS